MFQHGRSLLIPILLSSHAVQIFLRTTKEDRIQSEVEDLRYTNRINTGLENVIQPLGALQNAKGIRYYTIRLCGC